MGMNRYTKGVKKRREERLRLLREKQRRASGTFIPEKRRTYAQDEAGYFPYHQSAESEWSERRSETHHAAFLVKVVCAVLLVVGTFIVMNSDHPQLEEAQLFIHDVMHRDFNVQGVMNWYEQNVGAAPDFMPQMFSRADREGERVNEYVMPVSGGTVITAFGQSDNGITLETETTVPIEVVKEGWVTFVGEKEGHGLTVIIDHGGGEESWYGNVKDLKVQLHDWVEQGEVIGQTSVDEEGESTFYFAIKKDSVFIDPLDVIPFD